MDDPPDRVHVIDIPPRTELRIDCTKATAKVLVWVDEPNSQTEVFGAELTRVPTNVAGDSVGVGALPCPARWLRRGQRACSNMPACLHVAQIFSLKGCKLKVSGLTDEMDNYRYLWSCMKHVECTAAVHATLRAHRLRVRSDGTAVRPGPVCVVVGGEHCGRTTLARTLCNWAVRTGWSPLLADTDVGSPGVGPPGCVSATRVQAPIGSAGFDLTRDALPLSYFYGHAEPSKHPEHYKLLVDRLAERCRAMADASGIVVDTCPTPARQQLEFELLTYTIDAFRATVVAVVAEEDSLYVQLTTAYAGRSVRVERIPRSSGVVKRDRKAERTRGFGEYLNGRSPARQQQQQQQQQQQPAYPGPIRLTVDTRNKVPPVVSDETWLCRTLHRVGQPAPPASTLPIGAEPADEINVIAVPTDQTLMSCVLAVSYADDAAGIPDSEVAALVVVDRVDVSAGTLSCLTRYVEGVAPGRFLVAGSLFHII
jgi:polyribonucleotide 5'-hydroxyl-kinase